MSRYSSRFSFRETSLLIAPLVLAGIIGLLLTWRAQHTVPFLKTPTRARQVFWTPDGKVVAFVYATNKMGQDNSQLFVWNGKTGDLESQNSFPTDSRLVFPSPDGSRFWTFLARGNTMSVFDSHTPALPLAQIPQANFSPFWAKNRMYFWGPSPLSYDLQKHNYDFSETKRVQNFLPLRQLNSVGNITWSPNEKWALAESKYRYATLDKSNVNVPIRPKMVLLDWQKGQSITTFPGNGWATKRFLNDGDTIIGLNIFEAGDTMVRADIGRFSLASRKLTWSKLAWAHPKAKLTSALFSPNGRFLIVTSRPTSGSVSSDFPPDVYDCSTGKSVGTLSEDSTEFANEAQFSADSRYFAHVTQQGIEIVDLNKFAAEPNAG